MRAPTIALVAAAALLIASVSHAAPPGTPQVTVGADIKQLIFDWDDVSGAAYYRLMYKVGSGAYKPLRDNIPASTTQLTLSIAVHLYYWSKLRYAVAACNASGCTRSADISPQNLMLDSIGYFKASNSDPGDRFGNTVILSDDGRTLVVAAPQEDSNATGINGNQADNSSSCAGAVYVFRRTASGWRQEAYLKASVNQPGLRFGSDLYSHRKALAINADGSLLAVGAAEQDLNGISKAGVVQLYQRSPSGSWSLVATLQAPTPSALDRFGFSIDMSLDGRTLKVDGYAPFETATGKAAFRSHIFVRPGATWQHSVTLAGIADGDVCEDTRLSRAGNALVLNCINVTDSPHVGTYLRNGDTWFAVSAAGLIHFQRHTGFALDFDASHMALQDTRSQLVSFVNVYEFRGFWSGDCCLHSPAGPDTYGPKDFGRAIALNRTATLIAIGDISAPEDGAGVSPISMPGTERRGAVYVAIRGDNPAAPGSTTWFQRSVVKSPNPEVGDNFAKALAMCGTGHALAVGAETEDSKARGVDGDRTDNSATDSGAVYLY